ncbi:ABC transporter permease subunit [Fusobacterium sp. SYSU M8D902]|uniref:ABC transporter permease n=1 Tax=Fusobacterium sp. SYSU M8D902 TaxID=3159562 RepID=UPI0032E4A565
MKRYLQSSYRILSFILFIVIWEGVALFIDNSLLFPRVDQVGESLLKIMGSIEFLHTLYNTLSRLFLVILLSLLGATIVATISYKYKVVKQLLSPFIVFLRAVPTIAIIILVLIWSTTESVPIVVGSLILFPILYESILGALNNSDVNLLKMSKIYRVPQKRVITDIYIPSVYYSIAPNLPSYIGLTFKVIIAGEVLSQESFSIGGEIFLNKIYLESSNIFAWIAIVIVINYILENGLKRLNYMVSRSYRWK